MGKTNIKRIGGGNYRDSKYALRIEKLLVIKIYITCLLKKTDWTLLIFLRNLNPAKKNAKAFQTSNMWPLFLFLEKKKQSIQQ